MSCHATDGIAPFSLEDYESAQLMATAALAAVRARVMPPWLVTGDGSCQTFEDSRWMSDAEIDMLAAWVEDGMPKGKETAALEEEGEQPTLGPEVLELEMSDSYVPKPDVAGGHTEDDYRCFLLDPAQDRDRFITGFEVVAGDPTQVHHVLVYDVDPTFAGNGPALEAFTSSSEFGWSCFGAAGEGIIPSGLPVAWAPGIGITNYSAGTGLYLAQGHVLVMQIHYHLHGVDRPDRTKVRFGLTDQVEKPGFVLLPDGFLSTAFTDNPDVLPPGMSDVPYSWRIPAKEAIDELRAAVGSPTARLFLSGALPHMHGHGRSMNVSFTREGSPATCVADVFRWDFDWQRFYFYENPIPIEEDQLLDVTCRFDTSGETEPVLPGLGSDDEMCLFGMYVTLEL